MAQATLLKYFRPASVALRPDQPTHAQCKPLQEQEAVTLEKSLLKTQSQPLFSKEVSEDRIPDIAFESRVGQYPLALPLNPRAQICRVDRSHLAPLRRLTSSTLPVRYSEKFFSETITDDQAASLSRVVLYDERPVGWIRCRLEPSPGLCGTWTNEIYIQALCLLAPYRNCGLASYLLESVLASENLIKYKATFVYAHVWENNEDALVWYEKRNFKRTILIDQYYRRLKPSGAWIVRKDLG